MGLSLRNRIATVLTWTVLAATPALADDPQDGFALQELPYPGQSLTATLSSGEIVAFDGTHLDLYDENGSLLNNLATLPGMVFGSFLIVDPTETRILLGESSNHDILSLTIAPSVGTLSTVTNLVFNYDAVFEDADHILVSAATCGFGCGNDIVRVNLTTGVQQPLALMAGASGPVAVDNDGNLYYGTVTGQFPPPTNPSDVLRFDAAQLNGAMILTEADATIVATGLEGASDFAYDPVGGGLYLAATNFGSGVNVVRQVLGGNGNQILAQGTLFNSMSNLEFVPGDGQAEFVAYQPASSGGLRYNTTDFVSLYARRSITTLRPSVAITGPGTSGAGTFTVTLVDGPPNGQALLYYGPSSLFDPNEAVLQLRVPLFVGLDLPTLARAPGVLTLDGTGAVSMDYANPGGLEGLFAVQLLLLDDAGRIAGMSSAAFL